MKWWTNLRSVHYLIPGRGFSQMSPMLAAHMLTVGGEEICTTTYDLRPSNQNEAGWDAMFLLESMVRIQYKGGVTAYSAADAFSYVGSDGRRYAGREITDEDGNLASGYDEVIIDPKSAQVLSVEFLCAREEVDPWYQQFAEIIAALHDVPILYLG